MTDTPMDVDEFRREARAWIEANLEPRPRRPKTGRASATPRRSRTSPRRGRCSASCSTPASPASRSRPSTAGGGSPPAHERAFREEAAGYVTPDLGVAGGVTFGPIGRSILAHASPEFLERHIPKILSGEEIWCQFYSEPEAGSDLAGIRTRATRDGDHWIINGSKIWSSGAYYADWAMCLARTDWDVPKHRGPDLVRRADRRHGRHDPPDPQINGNAEFCEEFLDDVDVTDDDVIGEVNRGWAVTQTMLVYERGAGEIGRRRRSSRAQLAPDLVALARRVGRTDDPVARQAIARAHINDYAQYHLGRRIADRLRASATPDPAVAAYGKLAVGRVRTDPGPARAWRSAGQRRAGVGEGRRGGRPAGAQLPQRPRSPRSPPAPTRCSATASANGCSACPGSPASTPRSRSTRCCGSSRNWSGKVG